MKRIILLISMFFLCVGNIYGQERERVNLSIDLANNFIWKGMATNKTPVIQPSVTFLPENRFAFGLWASTPIIPTKEKIHEVDIFVDVLITPFLTFNITDYFVCDDGVPNYFNFGRDTTGHTVDAQLLFAHENFPLKVMVSSIFLGNDLNDKGDNNFSTYIEFGYGKINKYFDWDIFVGMVPFKSVNFYDVDKFSIINTGISVSKTFGITKNYSLPLSLKLSVNPTHKNVFLTLSATIFSI